jgi:myo-inositol-1(or 4)-monophosphatase
VSAVDPKEITELAVRSARVAGRLLLERFSFPAEGVTAKSTPTDLVSDADRDAERLIIETVTRARPGDGFLAEESGGGDSSTGVRWVIDPLDGTVNFLYGISVWAVSIAAEVDGDVLVAVVYDPSRDDMFSAVRGGGSYLNGDRISVSQETELSRSLVGTGFAYNVDIRTSQADVVRRVLPLVRDIRRDGSAALDLCSLARGRIDAFYESNMGAWDRAAGVLIAREAGATVTDLAPPFGNEIGVVAANRKLHDQLRALVLHGGTREGSWTWFTPRLSAT